MRRKLRAYPGYPGRLIAQERDEKVAGSDSLVRSETSENRQDAKSAKDLGSARLGCVVSFARSSQANAAQVRQVIKRENKMQQTDIGVGALFPAHENPPKTVHPAMCPLDYLWILIP